MSPQGQLSGAPNRQRVPDLGDGTHYGMPRKSILGLSKTYYGMFRGEAKGGEREGSRWLEELENRGIRR